MALSLQGGRFWGMFLNGESGKQVNGESCVVSLLIIAIASHLLHLQSRLLLIFIDHYNLLPEE